MLLISISLAAPAFTDEHVTPGSQITAGANGTVTLEWTAPGDDSINGRATRYDLRYRLLAITEAAFATSFPIPGLPAPGPAGQRERFTVIGLTPGTTYYFALKAVDDAGNWSRMSNVVSRTAAVTVGVEGSGVVEFSTPYPNPARDGAHFLINVPQESEVVVQIFDVTGRRVASLADGRRAAGSEVMTWNLRGEDGRRVGAGVYLVRARIGATRFIRRVIVTS